jgi:serine protease AprX
LLHARRRPTAPSPLASQGATWTCDSRGTTWTRSTTWTRRATAVLGAVTGVLAGSPAFASAAPAPAGPEATYVVRALPGHLAQLGAVLHGKGTVLRQIALIDADVVRLHAADAAALHRHPLVASVTLDRAVTLASARSGGSGTETLAEVAEAIGADALYAKGITGDGVDVALVDSGIAAVPGLSQSSVVNGPDLSFSSQDAGTRYVDEFGHGTHMAGIIAGKGPGFRGVAPDARLISVKVADEKGAADVSQVIAGIDWVVQHAHSDGLDIKVLSLSFGTHSDQDYSIDPLAYAAERAWHAGIVVVVSGGNDGRGSHGLTDPAIDPYVLAVGAADTTGATDEVAGFSARGNGRRNPDLVAPGAHVASLQVPGSTIDEAFPSARTGNGLFKGSGTSQAAAVTAGAAALLLSDRPGLRPDQVKALLMGTADDLGAKARSQGRGLVDVAAAQATRAPAADQRFATANGSGSLERSRGDSHVQSGGRELRGERDIFGKAWNGQGWWSQGWAGQGWLGQSWTGTTWASSTWAGQNWAGQGWLGVTWAGQGWLSQGWLGVTWA